MVDQTDLETQRLDIFLYRTRLLKTRSAACKIIGKGKVRLTRAGLTQRVKKTHTLVRSGDCLSFMRGQTLLDISIKAIPKRRGPASEARECYMLSNNITNTLPTAPNG